MPDVLRIGIVGLGLAGGAMVPVVRSHPGVLLVAAAEPQPALRERFARVEGLSAHPDLDSLLRRDDLDAVYVATPHQFHREHTVAAARSGRHVVVEKPMALSVADCDAMIAAAAEHGVQLVVGHTHGFDPAVLLLRRLVGDGVYGRLGSVASWNYTDFLYRPRRPEELDTSLGGGILFNQVPHQIEVVRTIADRPLRSVRAVTTALDPRRPTEGGCSALLEFADGASASLVYSGYDHFDSDELHGWVAEGGGRKKPAHGAARRALVGLDDAAETRARTERFGYGARATAAPAHQPHFGELVVSCVDADLRSGADDVLAYTAAGIEHLPVPRTPWRPGRGDVLQELVEAVTGERPALHDGVFGRETVRTCLAIAESARERREVVLGPTVSETEESVSHVPVP